MYTQRMPPIKCAVCHDSTTWQNRGINWSFCDTCFHVYHKECCQGKLESCPQCRHGTLEATLTPETKPTIKVDKGSSQEKHEVETFPSLSKPIRTAWQEVIPDLDKNPKLLRSLQKLYATSDCGFRPLTEDEVAALEYL
eukprot:TRINITY_DN10320_c0_g1_i1.p1 TRINITY_DN10320_c0_g1~~TRINITY_DN10320_c0_g1_i1.p1  ORF type:complete len:139 (+),score=6.19 TRINITY_DN10320_c0_g1_i1:590-1006(+)